MRRFSDRSLVICSSLKPTCSRATTVSAIHGKALISLTIASPESITLGMAGLRHLTSRVFISSVGSSRPSLSMIMSWPMRFRAAP